MPPTARTQPSCKQKRGSQVDRTARRPHWPALHTGTRLQGLFLKPAQLLVIYVDGSSPPPFPVFDSGLLEVTGHPGQVRTQPTAHQDWLLLSPHPLASTRRGPGSGAICGPAIPTAVTACTVGTRALCARSHQTSLPSTKSEPTGSISLLQSSLCSFRFPEKRVASPSPSPCLSEELDCLPSGTFSTLP